VNSSLPILDRVEQDALRVFAEAFIDGESFISKKRMPRFLQVRGIPEDRVSSVCIAFGSAGLNVLRYKNPPEGKDCPALVGWLITFDLVQLHRRFPAGYFVRPGDTPEGATGVGTPLPVPVRNWLIARYLADPSPGRRRRVGETEPERVVFERYETVAAFLVNTGYDLPPTPNLDAWVNAGWIEDVTVDVPPSSEASGSPDCPIARLRLPPGRHRLVGIRRAVLNLPPVNRAPLDEPGNQHQPAPAGSSTGPTASRPKRSTHRGDGRAKLIAALTRHHKYANGGCLHTVAISNNDLARDAGVSKSTASDFFNKKFQGHTKYKALCQDSRMLVVALKQLNGEYAPHLLYGQRPVGEGDCDDE
jgi:hypothetical protein